MRYAETRPSIDLLLFRRRFHAPPALLLAILVAALALRAYWVFHHKTVLAGVEYVRIADNLFNQARYVGLWEGPELMFPPLLPLLLAFGAILVGSVETAARLIPFFAGVLLVPAAFVLARFLYGSRIAFGVAVLMALHPVLIDLSATAKSETVYLPLMFLGLYSGLRGLDSGRPTHMLWCGTMFGLAYLTRPEALLFPFVVLVAILLTGLRSTRVARPIAPQCLCLVAPIVLLAAPYVAYLSLHTGSLRLEGKSVMNYTIGERRNAGMSHPEATRGIGPDLSEDGPQLSPNHFIIATAHHVPSMLELLSYWVKSIRRNKTVVFDLLLSPVFGSLLGIALAALGLFRQPWDQRRAGREAVLLSVTLIQVFLLLGLHTVNFRYVLPLVTVSWLWVVKGIDEVAQWGVETVQRAEFPRALRRQWVDTGIPSALITALLLLALLGLRGGSPFEPWMPRTASLRDVGTWLDHYHPGPKRVMTARPQVAYYSRGTFLETPYADGSLALRYIRLKQPDFIVLVEGDGSVASYLKQWLDEGIPDRSAAVIYRADEVVIYEWHG